MNISKLFLLLSVTSITQLQAVTFEDITVITDGSTSHKVNPQEILKVDIVQKTKIMLDSNVLRIDGYGAIDYNSIKNFLDENKHTFSFIMTRFSLLKDTQSQLEMAKLYDVIHTYLVYEKEHKIFKSLNDKWINVIVSSLITLSNNNNAQAQFQLGLMNYKGKSNIEDAIKWWKKAADQDHTQAQFNLGLMNYQGKYVTKNIEEAIKWWEKAADQDHTQAQLNLADIYNKGKYVPQNGEEAIKWWKKAAEQGNTDAQYNLGLMNYKGKYVTKNIEEAIKWWKKAADQGNTDAQFNLGLIYLEKQETFKWFSKAAEGGYAKEAFKWFSKAAEGGYAKAQYNLGLMYSKGEGTPKNLNEAIKWYEKASKGVHFEAKNELNRLKKSNPELFRTNNETRYISNYLKKSNPELLRANNESSIKREREGGRLDEGSRAKKQKK